MEIAAPKPAATRLEWIDAWRGLAVAWMIMTHCFNAFRSPAWLDSAWFPWLNYANGLVAPTFLFVAGFVQALGTRRAWAQGKTVSFSRARVGKLLLIFLLGYVLHFPWTEISQPAAWLKCLATVDVLPCLAVSLLILLALAAVVKCAVIFDLGCLVLIAAAVWLAPASVAWTADSPLGNALLSWVTPHHGALFPLLPWLGFVAAGALISRWQGRGGVFLTVAILAWGISIALPNSTVTWLMRSEIFCERLAWVLVIGGLFSLTPALGRIGALNYCGQHSLALYFIHLQIIYSVLRNVPKLREMSPAQAVILSTIITMTASAVIVEVWVKWKQWKSNAPPAIAD